MQHFRDIRELKHIASNHSSDIDSKDFMKLYKDYSNESFSFALAIQLYHQKIH